MASFEYIGELAQELVCLIFSSTFCIRSLPYNQFHQDIFFSSILSLLPFSNAIRGRLDFN